MNYELNQMFRFKQFTIQDSVCAMKVGTDGVILGAWADINSPVASPRILDIGTGSGLIAIMLAQRFADAHIDAIDIDADAIAQTKENVSQSPFCNRIEAWQTDLADMENEPRYDLIVSNPPFYQEDTSCPDAKRDTARHTTSLPFDTLLHKASTLLRDGGTFCVIIPTSAVTELIGSSAIHSLYLSDRTDIHTTIRKPAKRTLLAFTHNRNVNTHFDKLYLRDANNNISDEYKALTNDFYLNM
ncbi:MAG: methyltransferase [Bacteroidaceae bacterium]|nr:methyltransferase [Bacteroidaceae bacterium]